MHTLHKHSNPQRQREAIRRAVAMGGLSTLMACSSLHLQAQVQGQGQSQSVQNGQQLAMLQPVAGGEGALLIAPGDVLDMQVFNTPELSGKLRVSQDGTITLPAGGSVKVADLTPAQADAAIEQRLKDAQIMFDPRVTVLVSDYATQGIDVLGEVRVPGIYRFLGAHSLYDALSAAGGVTETEGSTIAITHHEDPDHPIIIQVHSANYADLERKTQVRPGDVVDVSRADTIFVVGDVVHSGQFPIAHGRPLNALDALALAAGPNKTAKLSHASIIRKTNEGTAQTISVDLHDIQKNTAADPILQADDVLVIPRSGARAFLEIAIPGATAAVIGAVAYSLLR